MLLLFHHFIFFFIFLFFISTKIIYLIIFYYKYYKHYKLLQKLDAPSSPESSALESPIANDNVIVRLTASIKIASNKNPAILTINVYIMLVAFVAKYRNGALDGNRLEKNADPKLKLVDWPPIPTLPEAELLKNPLIYNEDGVDI